MKNNNFKIGDIIKVIEITDGDDDLMRKFLNKTGTIEKIIKDEFPLVIKFTHTNKTMSFKEKELEMIKEFIVKSLIYDDDGYVVGEK